MSRRPEGHNLKYFNNDETQLIKRATASVSVYGEKLSFNVPADKKTIIKNSLGDIVAVECDTPANGTWLHVIGISNIKSALLKLKMEKLISEDFYNSIAKHFPLPNQGTINIVEQSYPTHQLDQGLFKKPTQPLPQDEFVLITAEDYKAEDTSKRDDSSRKCSVM